MNLDRLLSLMSEPIRDPAAYRGLLREVPGPLWKEVQARALARTLTSALQLPYYRERVDITPARIAADPFAAVLRFPPLRKQDYWDHGASLRLAGVPADHVFYTSGTEGGIPTEQPWDDWTFTKSFCEASALALTACDARPGERVLLGSYALGALGRSYRWACEVLGLSVQADEASFSDPELFREKTLPFARAGVEHIVGAPGLLVQLAHRLRDEGVDPRSLGVRSVISGIGTFLGDHHRDFLIEAFDPEKIHEQGGKNEILHAPGGRRHDRQRPDAISRPGFLHVLPWAAYVVAVDARRCAQGVLEPIGHEREGVLLMTRLSAGKDGCAAYINDACDLGMTLGFGGLDAPVGATGDTMPAFRFMGRASRTVENKLGDTLFTEEFVRALALAARDVGLDPGESVALRVQAVLVRDPDPRAPDTLYWLVGAPRAAFEARPEAIRTMAERLIRFWPKHFHYGIQTQSWMRLGGCAVVESAVFPHAGRDKPQYPLALDLMSAPGRPHAEALLDYLQVRLEADVLWSNAS